MSTINSSKPSKTDSKRLDEMGESDIDLSDIPEVSHEMFSKGIVRHGLNPRTAKRQVTFRLDADVIKWFRARGKGYQTQINALLRAYMDAHRKRP